MRFERTALYAHENNFRVFTSSLGISRWKDMEQINQSGLSPTPDTIRAFRDVMIKANKGQHNKIFEYSDFYSLSEFRDLVFHVKEHQFTVPEIKSFLKKLGLQFCCFESREISKRFKLRFSKADDIYNLEKWHLYEQENPDTFEGMYQFWCQKI